MTIEINMPALSPTMEVGTLSKWLVAEGDAVAAGDALAEIETDKATMEVESDDDGVVGKLLIAGGTENVPVGTLIAVLLEEGEEAKDIKASATSAAPVPPPLPVATSQDYAPDPKAPTATVAVPATPLATPAFMAPGASSDGRVKASPLAKRMAEQAGIALTSIAGSGPGGRIVKADVEAVSSGAAPAVAAPAAPVAAAPAYGAPDTPHEAVKLTNMRKIIAARLSESKQTVPHFYLTIDAEIDQLLDMRKRLNAQLSDDERLSVNDFIIRAVGLALHRCPDANVQYGGDVMYRFSRADVSVAVATPGGLITPIIRGADEKGLKAISAEIKDLASRAKEGKLAPEEYQGGTFSISNLGMYGIREFSAVINPPQGAILAIGAGEQRPIVRHGAVQVATVMTMTLSCDHRAIDGAVGAEFLGILKGFIEEPASMLL